MSSHLAETKTSFAASLSGMAAITIPGVASTGRSFNECTAAWTLPESNASSSSLVKSSFAANFWQKPIKFAVTSCRDYAFSTFKSGMCNLKELDHAPSSASRARAEGRVANLIDISTIMLKRWKRSGS